MHTHTQTQTHTRTHTLPQSLLLSLVLECILAFFLDNLISPAPITSLVSVLHSGQYLKGGREGGRDRWREGGRKGEMDGGKVTTNSDRSKRRNTRKRITNHHEYLYRDMQYPCHFLNKGSTVICTHICNASPVFSILFSISQDLSLQECAIIHCMTALTNHSSSSGTVSRGGSTHQR